MLFVFCLPYGYSPEIGKIGGERCHGYVHCPYRNCISSAFVGKYGDRRNFIPHAYNIQPTCATPKGSFKSFDPLTWTLIPIAYLIFAVVRAEISPLMFSGFGGTSSRYPYPFMDFDLLGTGKGILIIIVMSVIYIAMGYLLYVLDRLLGKKRKS